MMPLEIKGGVGANKFDLTTVLKVFTQPPPFIFFRDFFHRQIISDPISPELKLLEKRMFADIYGAQNKVQL